MRVRVRIGFRVVFKRSVDDPNMDDAHGQAAIDRLTTGLTMLAGMQGFARGILSDATRILVPMLIVKLGMTV